MTHARVVVRDAGRQWHDVGQGFRQPRGGGWNLMFKGGVPDAATLVLMDAGEYAPGDRRRVFVTRPGDSGGTDWFEVGRAFVSAQGRAVMVNLDVHLPAGEQKLVLLPPRRGQA